MNLIGERVSTDMFHYDPAKRLFTALDGDLRIDLFSQVFDDSCDQGFVMVSAKTGKEVAFTFHRMVFDDFNDVVFWEFVSYRITPEVFVRVYNN